MEFNAELKILDLIEPQESHPNKYDDLASLTYSALMSAKQPSGSWHKPAYVFSRFVADCCRYSGIQAIKYPSTHIVANNFNLVVVDQGFDLHAAAKLCQVIQR